MCVSSITINRLTHARHKSVVVMSLTFKHPFTGMVVGPTSCGKTRFVFRLIDNVVSMLEPPSSKIMYCYGEYQQLFCQYPQVIFHEGLPDMNNFDGREPILLIVDDLMQETNETIANLFTKGSHHRNVSQNKQQSTLVKYASKPVSV